MKSITTLAIAALSFSSCAILPIFGGEDRDEDPQLRLSQAIESRDIMVGMSASHVRAAWGDPYNVEYAGSPDEGNERWTYQQGPSSAQFRGLTRQKRVYFERGRVIGWESGSSN